jgi:hypothetical protein
MPKFNLTEKETEELTEIACAMVAMEAAIPSSAHNENATLEEMQPLLELELEAFRWMCRLRETGVAKQMEEIVKRHEKDLIETRDAISKEWTIERGVAGIAQCKRLEGALHARDDAYDKMLAHFTYLGRLQYSMSNSAQ